MNERRNPGRGSSVRPAASAAPEEDVWNRTRDSNWGSRSSRPGTHPSSALPRNAYFRNGAMDGTISLTPTLDHPLATHVIGREGAVAGVVVRALEREGLNIRSSWSSLADFPQNAPAPLDLVVVVEPDGAPYSDDDYAAIRAAAPYAAVVAVCAPDRESPQRLIWSGADVVVFEPGA